ncbi:MAG: zf-TFIIB domain-containing protein [Acidimicrobiia bacterium]|nr:zf-TFIIB domain-containing protein [Acidimicrobiia bacterium]
MQCPVDGNTLLISERQSVEIDYCPQCRGVWLDRGELDKLIQRDDDDSRDHDRPRERQRDYDDDDRGSRGFPKKKKRGSLSDLFDFG